MLLGVLLTWWMMDTADGAENKKKDEVKFKAVENTDTLLKLRLKL